MTPALVVTAVWAATVAVLARLPIATAWHQHRARAARKRTTR
ncbi:hypothetical protein F4556_002389 [Kitasatospora gansuensis]|uniref:Uncharacterized protein n=1 Tax=Kitasatospora gansuensis TaxID=258050 RepID=A0A7W7SAF2_9ACTN|nr:hypothetical protein [Kitasatospora gansuensis]MBB4946854.1 hypothetical protein [Kitasatospora gansuensis]